MVGFVCDSKPTMCDVVDCRLEPSRGCRLEHPGLEVVGGCWRIEVSGYEVVGL